MFVEAKSSNEEENFKLMTITLEKAFSYKAFLHKENFKVSVRETSIDTKFLKEKKHKI